MPATEEPELLSQHGRHDAQLLNGAVDLSTAQSTSRPAARAGRCRPRIHDLRHSLACTVLIDWYRSGVDVQARLPLLSSFMGHVKPESTYWYLSASPELLGLASRRLEDTFEEGR